MAAALQVRDATNTDRVIAAIKVRDAANVDRTITQGRIIGPDGIDRVFWDPSGTVSFSATASPAHVGGSSIGTGTATTSATTVTPTGGTAPYSYSWACIDHSNSTAPTASNPTGAASAFTQINLLPGEFAVADFVCTVTDSSTPANSTTATVSAGFQDRS